MLAGSWAKQRHAVAPRQGNIALCGRSLPHLPVHGGGDNQRDIARQTQRGQQIIGPALRKPGDEVSRGGCNEDGIGVAAEIDMRHVVRHACVPKVRPYGIAGQSLKGHGGNEARAGFGQHDVNVGAGLAKEAYEFCRLVRGHAASHTHHDFPVLQSNHDIRL